MRILFVRSVGLYDACPGCERAALLNAMEFNRFISVDVGERFKLLTNHVRVAVDDDGETLYHYHVDFAPADVDKR